MTEENKIPNEVLTALLHVHSFHPTVDRVVFWEDGEWCYMNEHHQTPTFDEGVDVDILNRAASWRGGDGPIAYQLPEDPRHYEVRVDRTSVRSINLRIEAGSPEEAERIACDSAGDFDFNLYPETGVEYQAEVID